jgi:hypothetical protein
MRGTEASGGTVRSQARQLTRWLTGGALTAIEACRYNAWRSPGHLAATLQSNIAAKRQPQGNNQMRWLHVFIATCSLYLF